MKKIFYTLTHLEELSTGAAFVLLVGLFVWLCVCLFVAIA